MKQYHLFDKNRRGIYMTFFCRKSAITNNKQNNNGQVAVVLLNNWRYFFSVIFLHKNSNEKLTQDETTKIDKNLIVKKTNSPIKPILVMRNCAISISQQNRHQYFAELMNCRVNLHTRCTTFSKSNLKCI